MAEFMSYDPWANIVSRNGIPGDELVSGLQKSCRRGNVEDAVRIAYEMYITSEQFEDKLWRRLNSICVEDIGFGEPYAPILIHTLDEMRKKFPYSDGDRPMFFIHAIRYICRCKKERSSDCLKNIVIKEFEHGGKPTIPDYAYDMHTKKGREMGRDFEHFLNVASRVEPVMDGYDDTYRQKLLEIIAKEENGTIEEQDNPVAPFSYNTWQQ